MMERDQRGWAHAVGRAMGRTLMLAALVAAVLGAIWLLASLLTSRSSHAAEMILLDARVAATTWSEGDAGRPPGFAGFTPETAARIKALTWNTSSTAVPGEVSIRAATATSVVLVTMGPAGPRCVALVMSDDGPPRTTYGVADAGTVAGCDDPSW